MRRVKHFQRCHAVFRLVGQSYYSSLIAVKWIKQTLFARSQGLFLNDLVINAPNMDRQEINKICKSMICIIDQNDGVLRLPVIDFDVKKCTDQIVEACSSKPLFGVVRGMGGGKTRILEEIRRNLLQMPDTFPVAIAFGNLWDIAFIIGTDIGSPANNPTMPNCISFSP